jgi:hypothetical protein
VRGGRLVRGVGIDGSGSLTGLAQGVLAQIACPHKKMQAQLDVWAVTVKKMLFFVRLMSSLFATGKSLLQLKNFSCNFTSN